MPAQRKKASLEKIFTIRDIDGQREHMWSTRRIEEEVAACSRRNISRYFLRYLPKDAPILEAGCGLGAWVIYLSGLGYEIAGIDNDPNVIDRLKRWRPGVRVGFGNVLNLPNEDNSLGAVISLGVVEHFEEGCGAALREAYRVLKPGGGLFLTVPMENVFRMFFAHPLRRLYLWWRKRGGDRIHFGEYRFRKSEVEDMVRASGFEPVLFAWDDFLPKTMSLGIWADFPPLQACRLYEMNALGKGAALLLNTLSPWIAAAGVLCLARKPGR